MSLLQGKPEGQHIAKYYLAEWGDLYSLPDEIEKPKATVHRECGTNQ